MPTIIALDVSLSMQATISTRYDQTYHQLALKGISHFLDLLSNPAKLEHVALLTYSMSCELKVDFTREYDLIRQAAKKVETSDKACVITMLKSVASVMNSNWGVQNICNVVIFTDCGIGFGSTAIKGFLQRYMARTDDTEFAWLDTLKPIKLNIVCMGLQSDEYFSYALVLYQQLIDLTGLNGQLFMTKSKAASNDISESVGLITLNSNSNNNAGNNGYISTTKTEFGRNAMSELIESVYESNYKPYETVLKCGGYFRLESPIYIWPSPSGIQKDVTSEGNDGYPMTFSSKLEVCGFLSLNDIGLPATLGRHLILAKVERERDKRKDKGLGSTKVVPYKSETNQIFNEYEKFEADLRDFYTKDNRDNTDENSEDSEAMSSQSKLSNNEYNKESMCVLLHSALKSESMAALVLLNENWYGYIFAYSDKKKSNLMLNVLPPGSDVVPWLGDLNMLGFAEDLAPGESGTFPVKAEKRSYSQSCVVWIRKHSLQADIQKVLRHAKKMPEKTQQFYKELNRLRRSALAIGFVEVLEGLATLLEKELQQLQQMGTVNAECLHQLQHAASELNKPSCYDSKINIVPMPKYAPNINALQMPAAVAGYSKDRSGLY